MRTSLAVPMAGALGLLTILRASVYYYGADRVAFFITLLMGAALLLGIAELMSVSERTRQLRAELQGLPAAATDEHLARATPLLRALVSARLDRTSLPVPAAVFAPFLVGLLVMLGLLGTFLGLFETLRGTGQALTASADVDALRAGLRAPIGGLMRGFGTSAAGVASSALLGLAAVFVRRDNARLSLNLYTVASGPLARYSSAQRELIALESLARQGEAWPKAAQAMTDAALALKALETSWQRTQLDASAQGRAQLEAMTERIRAELRAGVTAAAGFAQDSTAKLSSLGDDWRKAHADAAEQTQLVLRGAAAQVGEAVRAGVANAAQAGSAALQPLLEQVVSETTAAVSAHLTEVRATMAHDTGERSAQLKTQMGALHGQLDDHARAFQAAEQTRSGLLAQQWQALAAAAEQQISTAAQRESARAHELAQLSQQVRDDLATTAALVRARLDQGSQQEQQQQTRADELMVRLGEASHTIAAAAADQVGALQQFVEATDGRLQASEARSAERMQSLLQSLTEASAAQAQRMADFEQSLLDQHQESGEQLRERLAAHTSKFDQDLERTASLVAQAATLIHGGGAELAAMVEGFAAAVEQQRQGARAWLESLGEIERAVADAGERAAADVLGQHLLRTHELFDRQLQFQSELIEQLRGSRRDSMIAPRSDAAR